MCTWDEHFDDTADRGIDVYVFMKLADAWVCHGLFGFYELVDAVSMVFRFFL